MEYSQEQQQFADEVALFARERIMPFAEDIDQKEYMPEEIIKDLARSGYLAAMIPKIYGGLELDFVSIGILNEMIGKACSSVRSLLTVHGMVVMAIRKCGTREQQQKYLPKMLTGEIIGAFGLTEPDTGSDAQNIKTTAEKIGNEYRITGEKKWITFGHRADLFLVFAKAQDGISAFLIEREHSGLTTEPMNGLLGTRGAQIARVMLDHCLIPDENIVGNPGMGLSFVAVPCLDYGRYTIAFGCVGMGQACLDLSLSYVRKRKQFGVPLRKHQLIQQMITKMVVSVKAARLLCINAGELKDKKDAESIMETWNAKYYASKMVHEVTSDAVQIHGANGCSFACPAERFYRDAKIMEIIEGTSQMHEILIASHAIRGASL